MTSPALPDHFGVVYIATGTPYIQEALTSVRTLRSFHPDWPVALFTDQQVEAPGIDHLLVIEDPEYSLLDKVRYLPRSPFRHSLFLDTDVAVRQSLGQLPALLHRFDVLGVQDVARMSFVPQGAADVPRSFPEINTGVLLYRQCPDIDHLFAETEDIYQAAQDEGYPAHKGNSSAGITDQFAFRIALYRSNVRLGILPYEYNYVPTMASLQPHPKIEHYCDRRHDAVAAGMIRSGDSKAGRTLIMTGLQLRVLELPGAIARMTWLVMRRAWFSLRGKRS